MKKKIILLLTIAAMLSFASCGIVDEGGKSAEPQNSAAAQEAPGADNGTPEEDNAPEEEAPAEDDETTGDEPETDAGETEPSGDGNGTDTDTPEQEPYYFSTPGGEYTYEELRELGLANCSDGVYFALVSEGGGAGHAYYTVYTSTNGADWEQGEPYSELNGRNTHIALDDGRIILFSYLTAANEPYPVAYVLTLSGSGIYVEDKPNYLDALTFDDGTPLDGYGEVSFSAVYEGGYSLHLTISGAEGGMLDGVYQLDPDTLDLII